MKIKRNDINEVNDLNEILFNLTEKHYPDFNNDNFDNLDIVTQTFALIIDADGQINNGGVIQFIDNESGNRFHETIDAAFRIKNDILIKILTKITNQYPNGQIPKDSDERRDLWEELCEQNAEDENWSDLWEELDNLYYDNSETIHQNLIDYIKTNATIVD